MRNILAKLLVGIALTVPLAFGADNNFIGTWKLNLEKSKFNPGPGPKSFTVMIEAAEGGEKSAVTGENSDGTPINSSPVVIKYDGKYYPVTGAPFDSMSIKQLDADTHILITKKAGKVVSRGKAVISGDTMTVTTTGTNPEGKKFNDIAVYDKQ